MWGLLKLFIGLAGAIGYVAAAGAAGVSDNEIVVGTHLDLSGPVAPGMPQLRNGTQMRFDEVNEAGGVNGRKIRLIVEDNGSQPQMAVRAMEKLTKSDHVFALVNSFGSGTNAAAVKRVTAAGVIYFSPWGASAILHKIAGDTPLLFTTIPNYDSAMALALGWMIDQYKPKKIGFIHQEGPLGELVRAGVKKALDKHGMTVTAEAGYKAGDIDFSSQVARMKAADVDLIVTATITRETVGVQTEIQKIGWNNVRVITASPGHTLIVLKLGKAALNGLYGAASWKVFNPAEGTDWTKKWAASYKKRFNLDADENALLAYAYADWFVRGLQAAGRDLTTDSMVKALQASTDDNVIFFASEHFDHGHISPEAVRVDQAKDGRWLPVSPLLQ
jgi:ABC-type branched-subunit amino acid transport system substrate-binding protein